MHHKNREDQEIAILRDIDRTEHAILDRLTPKLNFIKITHGECQMQGPFTFPNVGAKITARVLGFDQMGQPFDIDFTNNPVTWSVDNPAIFTSTPESDPSIDDLVAVSGGAANLTATCGGFTDTEAGTVPVVVPVLSSIKIDTTPA